MGKNIQPIRSSVVRFAGDSGDGIQVIGTQMSLASSATGNDVHTFPDFPAEIRAPAGTLYGVSGFQLCFSEDRVHTHGDDVDTLVAFNPAALKTNIEELKKGGILILNEDKFTEKDLLKAGFIKNPLEDDSLKNYKVIKTPISKLVKESLKDIDISFSQKLKCKNMFALGITYWLYEKSLDKTLDWINSKFKNNKELLKANQISLKAGYDYAVNVELLPRHFTVPSAKLEKGIYNQVTGSQAISLGCASVAAMEENGLFAAGYPITPSSDILHHLYSYSDLGINILQAEDEIASVCACIGASYGGTLSITFTSGPGLDLKAEGIGLAVMTELPLVVVDVQRAGPSTGMPTKPEQSDLLTSMYGRHGECEVPILSPNSPADGFYIIREAFRIAVSYMVPVIVLSDAFLANSSESWKLPDIDSLKNKIKRREIPAKEDFHPYLRNEQLVRSWVYPGMKGYEHRIGGLEKCDKTGTVSYDPGNHQKMVNFRSNKIKNIKKEIPKTKIYGEEKGDLLIVTWGCSFGASLTALNLIKNKMVGLICLRYINPLPDDLNEIFNNFKKIVVVELNSGQLAKILKVNYLREFLQINKITGKPFKVSEILEEVDKI